MTAESNNSEKSRKSENVMSFWDHLEELRSRLIKSLLFLTCGLCVAYFFVPYAQDFILSEFFPSTEDKPLAFLKPTEGFIVKLKLSLMGGLILSSPAIFYNFWRFVAPGLYPKEKRFIIPIVITSTFSFLIGAGFSLLILPHATNFFLSFSMGIIDNTWSFGSYVDFVIRIMLAFGLVFELPLVIYFLVRLGIVTPEFLRSKRRYAIIIFLILSAVISPPDIFTMVVLAIPLTVLYELSILIAVIARKKYQAENP